MKFGWQSIIGPVFWIAATYLAMTYGPELVAKARGESGVRSQESEVGQNLNQTILGQESENNAEENGSFKLPASPQEVPQYVREIIERTTNTVIERGQSQVEEKKTEVVKNTCGQIIAEIEKQCNITTSNK